MIMLRLIGFLCFFKRRLLYVFPSALNIYHRFYQLTYNYLPFWDKKPPRIMSGAEENISLSYLLQHSIEPEF